MRPCCSFDTKELIQGRFWEELKTFSKVFGFHLPDSDQPLTRRCERVILPLVWNLGSTCASVRAAALKALHVLCTLSRVEAWSFVPSVVATSEDASMASAVNVTGSTSTLVRLRRKSSEVSVIDWLID